MFIFLPKNIFTLNKIELVFEPEEGKRSFYVDLACLAPNIDVSEQSVDALLRVHLSVVSLFDLQEGI